MSVRVHVEWETSDASRMIEGIALRSLTFEKPFIQARERLAAAWSSNATSGGSLVGGWRNEKPGPWSADGGLPRLRRTGALEESLANLRGKPNNIGTHRATFGTNVRHAKFHQYGTENMPSREIVFQPPYFAKALAGDVADYLVNENWGPSMARRMLP